MKLNTQDLAFLYYSCVPILQKYKQTYSSNDLHVWSYRYDSYIHVRIYIDA